MTEPLVLLPGLLCDAVLWRHQLMHFSGGRPVMVGCLTWQTSIDQQAQSVLDAAPPRFNLAGLSMGGYCALEIMRRAPERVIRLALLDTSATTDTPELTGRRRMLLELNERHGLEPVIETLMPLLLGDSALSKGPLAETVANMMRRIGGEVFERQQCAIMGRADSRPGLGRIRCPTLVVCGAGDAIFGVAEHERISAAIPASRLEIIEDCGHLSTLEQGPTVTVLMEKWMKQD